MTTMLSPSLEPYFSHEPDYIEGGEDYTHTLRLWMPDQEFGGLALLDFNRNGKPNRGTSPYEEIELIQDVDNAVNILRRLSEQLPALYDHLGVATSRTAEQSKLRFPHGETLVRKLGELPLRDDQRPPSFVLQPDGVYSARTYLEHLVHDQAFSMANEGPYAVHDLVTHALPAQILVPPDGMENIGANSRATLETDDEAAIGQLMGTFDGDFSSVAYGYFVAEALRWGGKIGITSWELAISRLNPQGTIGFNQPLALHAREYCQDLESAARSLPEMAI